MRESNDSLHKILTRPHPVSPATPPPAAPPPEDADALTMADMHGNQAMRPANKNLTRLHIVDRHGKVRSFQYAFLDVESSYDGGTFTLVFAGTKHWQITVKGHGKMFWAVYDYISLHRWPYLREAPRDFAQGDETVFTEITIVEVTPKDRD